MKLKLFQHWWTALLALAIALPLLIFGYDYMQTIEWVSHTDLEIEFIATSDSTGKPISQAKIEFTSDYGLNPGPSEKYPFIITDDHGFAHQVFDDTLCFGTTSGLKFTDTFVVQMPALKYQVSAEGFKSTEPISLEVLETRKQTAWVSPGKSKLVVKFSLKRINQ